MPLGYLVVVVWAIVGMLVDGEVGVRDTPQWMMIVAESALYVTVAMWPIYIAWLAFSKMLTWREKGQWLGIVILLNMVGMPWFYVFMIRRYLGLEGRTRERDNVALDRFLRRHAVGRDRLSSDQLTVLRSYCRDYRLTRWCVAPTVVVAAVVLYTAVVILPKSCVQIFDGFIPTRVVYATGTVAEIAPEPEALKLYLQIVMTYGAVCGRLEVMGIFTLGLAIYLLWGNQDRKVLIEFLKATDREHLTNPST